MRTTVTLDADTESLLREAMRQRGLSFRQALNDAVRRGLAGVADDPSPFVPDAVDANSPTMSP